MAGRQSSWLASLCLFMCILLSFGGESIAISNKTKALDDKTIFFATQAVTSERIIGNGVKSPSRARRHVGRQRVAHFACRLTQHSCLALTIIALSGDVELNPSYRSLKNTKEFRGLKIAHLKVSGTRRRSNPA